MQSSGSFVNFSRTPFDGETFGPLWPQRKSHGSVHFHALLAIKQRQTHPTSKRSTSSENSSQFATGRRNERLGSGETRATPWPTFREVVSSKHRQQPCCWTPIIESSDLSAAAVVVVVMMGGGGGGGGCWSQRGHVCRRGGRGGRCEDGRSLKLPGC